MTTTPAIIKCKECLKPEEKCICDLAAPQSTRLKVLILQHPQEAKKLLGTAMLTKLCLDNATLRVGLSWKSLKAALKDETATPARWAVLFLGAKKDLDLLPADAPYVIIGKTPAKVTAKGLDGIILLDGNWQQSKTLWWRNPWLSRLNRIILRPEKPSKYGQARKEPRKTALATIEAAAECLGHLGEPAEVSENLRQSFANFLKRVRI